MKNTTRLAIQLSMVVMCILSWGWLIVNTVVSRNNVQRLISHAQIQYERKLYKLASDEYFEVLKLQQSEELYQCLLDSLRGYYKEEQTNSARNSLLKGYSNASAAYPNHTSWWEEYAQIYLDSGSSANAVKVLRQAADHGVSGENLHRQWNEAYYAVRPTSGRYMYISPASAGGRFVVQRGDKWGAISGNGSESVEPVYAQAGPVGEGGWILFGSGEGEYYLLDSKGIMQGRFEADIEECLGYGGGGIPVRLAGRSDWCFLLAYGEEAFSGYQAAGRFQGGIAPVKKDGAWYLINGEDEDTGVGTWDEIFLDETGGWLTGEVMLAKRDGVWNLWNKIGKQIGSLSAEEVDAARGGYIAFARNGKWGYADTNGNEVLSPSYAAAKSFSGGVGAVSDGKQWGFINPAGELIITHMYADVGYFNAQGCCPVQLEDDDGWRLLKWLVER